jgi:hypothetical protein
MNLLQRPRAPPSNRQQAADIVVAAAAAVQQEAEAGRAGDARRTPVAAAVGILKSRAAGW